MSDDLDQLARAVSFARPVRRRHTLCWYLGRSFLIWLPLLVGLIIVAHFIPDAPPPTRPSAPVPEAQPAALNEQVPAMAPAALPPEKPEQAIEMDAPRLSAIYRENEVAGDVYKGSLLDVRGVVVHVRKDLSGRPYVVLRGEKGSEFQTVDCYFRIGDDDQLFNVGEGETIQIRGRCGGLFIGNVIIGGCRVLGF